MTTTSKSSRPVKITAITLKLDASYIHNLIINSGKEYNAIIIVGRWWLHLWHYLAKKLWIHHVQCMWIKRISKKKWYEVHSWIVMWPEYNYLIVDDIVNTWQTFSMIASELNPEAQYDFVCQVERANHTITTDKALYSARRYSDKRKIDFYYDDCNG